jgi:putative methyltransferase (TIGR04325 family)
MGPQLAKDLATLISPVQAIRERRYERSFRGHLGLHRGLFASFSDARRSAPPCKPVGMDSPAYVDHHTDRADYIQAYDYPVLFWLDRILGPGSKVVDLGGNVGVHYHAYARYLEYPAGLAWVVCELPNIVLDGERIARERHALNLTFTTRFADANGSDIMIAAGVLQYIEEPLAAQLSALHDRPRHLLLNKLPLYDGEPFVTLQNSGPVYAPQHVFNRAQFVTSLADIGYELVDAWDVPGFACNVPFQSGRAVRRYSGLYLRRTP